MNLKKILLLVAAVIAVAVFSSCSKKVIDKGFAENNLVNVTHLEKKKFKRNYETPVTLRAITSAFLTPKVSAVVSKFFVDEGARVKKGEKLVQLDMTDYSIALAVAKSQMSAAEAAVQQAEAAFNRSKADYDRYQKLFEQNSIAKSNFDAVKSGYEQTKAALAVVKAQKESAESALRNSRQQLSYTVIKAPFDGYIVARLKDIGEMASPQTPVFEIVDINKMKLDVFVGEMDLPLITKGMNASIKIDSFPDKVFTGSIEMINSKIDDATKSAKVRVVMENSEHLIKSGMSARVSIVLPEVEFPVLPRNSIFTRNNETGLVYIVKPDKTVYTTDVVIGETLDGYTVIKEGVSENMTVVIGGGRRLEEGQTVRVNNQVKE